jgi:hypothetical protein
MAVTVGEIDQTIKKGKGKTAALCPFLKLKS